MKWRQGGVLAMALLSPMVHSNTVSVERDIFQPITGHIPSEDAIALWVLEGVIGHSTGWSGWLSAPGQGWVMVNVGDAVATTGWVVITIDEYGVEVEKRVMDAAGREQRWGWKLPPRWLSQSTDMQ